MYGHCLYLHFLDRFNVLYSLRYENGQGSFIYTIHNMTNIFVRPFVEPNWTLCDQYRINSHFYSISITQRVRTKLESDRFSFQFNFPAKMCRNWVGIGQLRSSYPLVIYFSIFTEKIQFSIHDLFKFTWLQHTSNPTRRCFKSDRLSSTCWPLWIFNKGIHLIRFMSQELCIWFVFIVFLLCFCCVLLCFVVVWYRSSLPIPCRVACTPCHWGSHNCPQYTNEPTEKSKGKIITWIDKNWLYDCNKTKNTVNSFACFVGYRMY